MPVYIIPRDRTVRHSSSSSRCLPYRYSADEFPALPRTLENGNAQYAHIQAIQQPSSMLKRSAGWPIKGVTSVEPPTTVPAEVATTASIASDNSFHGFLRLPQELRLMIWYSAFQERLGEIKLREYVASAINPHGRKVIPSFCYFSRQTLEEVLAVVIEGSQFMIASIIDNKLLRDFLGKVPGRFGLCRQLNFDYFSRFPQDLPVNQDLELAVACSGLRTIKLTFHADALTHRVYFDEDDEGFSRDPRAAEEIFSNFKLKRLLACDRLEKIIIEHTGSSLVVAGEAASELGKLLQREFAQKLAKQNVVVEYTCRTRSYGCHPRY